ncbi:c-type cytochrome domain-containing protein [Rubripirellula reticaptiva]|uniref:Planctomycete cytochrome C n=1 Tax=Rubripirellula reticaptiva TaxID=2528013 RepID=A0A5C6EUB5_9BACT|nr:c-type cytochrome domain-containing protein [Rubripirellula reticaptiva]TWU51697.1 Planctomycete cytochrome C [Rubripirellula reticaptiva]
MRFYYSARVRAAFLFFAWLSPQTIHADDAEKLAAEVKNIFRARCAECHGKTRREADIEILETSSFVGEDNFVTPGSVDDSSLYDYIVSEDEGSRMPEPPLPPLESFEIETVRKWIEAGAPAFPKDIQQPDQQDSDSALSNVVGAEYVLTQILKHVKATPRDDRPFLRFFSSNHSLVEGATAAELKVNGQALSKAMNHLSWEPAIVKPTKVDEIGSIYAVDIRKLGWHKRPFRVVDAGTETVPSSTDLYDMVLLEYPYALAFENSETFDELWETYLQPAELIRPIPFVRIDWFVSVATQFPLYEDMLQIPFQLHDLETELGVDSAENIENHIAKRAGMTVSGVSRNNRVVERHPARYGAYWKSYDFETSKGQQNMFVDPIDFHFAGGEMIWNLPNGLQGYLITDNLGNRINAAPTSIVTDKFAEDKVVRNGLACMRCHDRGMKRFNDNIRPAFVALPDSTGLDKRDILRMYVAKDEMDELLDRDEKKFMRAMNDALGEPQDKEPLIPLSRRFLDSPLAISQAAAELGLQDSGNLQQVFRLPQFTRLGLAGLSAGGVVRRDTWEDYFDRISQQLGLGVPISPIDGLTRPDHLSDGIAFDLKLKTNKRSNIFSPGDDMVIQVENKTGQNLFVEMIGTSSRGSTAILTDGVISLQNGSTLRFPENGSIKIRPQLGIEFITIFAKPTRFEAGVLLRGKGVADRFVHQFYDFNNSHLSNVPEQLIKKTIKIETR